MSTRPRCPLHTVCVQNLPNNSEERAVRKAFNHLGEIQHVKVVSGGANKKKAYINFFYKPDAEKAVADFNGKLWDKSVLQVKLMDPMKDNMKQSFPFNITSNSGTQQPHVLRYPVSGPRHPAPPMSPHQKPSPLLPNPYFRNPRNPRYPMQGPHYSRVFPPNNINQIQPLPDFNISKCDIPLKEPELREIECMYVEDAVTFYGLFTSHLCFIESLTIQLQQLCPTFQRLSKMPDKEKIYAVLCDDDSRWYRCILKEIKSLSMYIVHLIDCGNVMEVTFHQLVELPDVLKKYPPFAHKCFLSYLDPCIGKKDEALKYLREILLNARIVVTTNSPQGSHICNINDCHCDGVDINEVLLEKGFTSLKPELIDLFKIQKKIPTTSNKKPSQHSNEFSLLKEVPTQSQNQSEMKTTILMDDSAMKNNARIKDENQKLALELNSLKNEFSSIKFERDLLKEQVLATFKNSQAPGLSDTEKRSEMSLMHSTASHLQLVNSIRRNPTSEKDSDIYKAIELLKFRNGDEFQSKLSLQRQIADASALYDRTADDIHQCSEMANLDALVMIKATTVQEICRLLKEYETTNDPSPNDLKNFKEMIAILKEKLGSGQVPVQDRCSFEDVLQYFTATMFKRKACIEKAQGDTNKSHEVFLDSMNKLYKIFNLYSVESASTDCSEIADVNKAMTYFGSASNKLLKDMEIEVNVSLFSDKEIKPAVVDCLVRELRDVLEQIECQCQLKRKYAAKLKELTSPPYEATVTKLLDIRKEMDSLKIRQLRHKLLEPIDSSDNVPGEVFRELHLAMHKEDEYIDSLSKTYTISCPELDHLHPGFKLSQYSKYNGLFKPSWRLDNFNLNIVDSDCGGICYESKLLHEPVIIKGFDFTTEKELDDAVLKAFKWKKLTCQHLVSIMACFLDNHKLYVVSPILHSLADIKAPLSQSRSYNVLIAVLKGISALHSNSSVHASIHPYTVLLHHESAKLGFHHQGEMLPSFKGISFRAPELSDGSEPTPSCDIFSFGCLLLWVLFPDIQFESSSNGEIELSTVTDVMAQHFSSHWCATMSFLLHRNPTLRPSSKELFEKKFLAPILKISSQKFQTLSTNVKEYASKQKIFKLQSPKKNSEINMSLKESVVSVPPIVKEILSTDASKEPANEVTSANANNTLQKLFSMRQSIKLHSGEDS